MVAAYEFKKDFDSRNANIVYIGELKHYRFRLVKDDDVRSFISLLFLFLLMLIGFMSIPRVGGMEGSTSIMSRISPLGNMTRRH